MGCCHNSKPGKAQEAFGSQANVGIFWCTVQGQTLLGLRSFQLRTFHEICGSYGAKHGFAGLGIGISTGDVGW